MKWFQHSVDSHDDPDLSDAWDDLGDSGIVMFWVTLEIYGREFDNTDDDGWLDISWAFLRRKLRKSSAKVQLFLNYFSERQRIFSTIEGDRVRIKVPKFIERADTWTKTRHREAKQKLRSDCEETSTLLIEVDKNKKKSTPPSPPKGGGERVMDGFDDWWEVWPKKVARAEAEKAWKTTAKKRPPLADLLQAVENQKRTDQWARGIIPNPATWLRASRWEDDLDALNNGGGRYKPKAGPNLDFGPPPEDDE